jgi:hypothetical protein
MDILSNPMFTIVPFALWIGMIAVALYMSLNGAESPHATFRSPRDILDELLTRRGIDREEYVERRKALDHATGLV